MDHADSTILTWAMVESAEALHNLDAILATPGLDGVYVGPNDLALSLGEVPGRDRPPGPVAEALGTLSKQPAPPDAGRESCVHIRRSPGR